MSDQPSWEEFRNLQEKYEWVTNRNLELEAEVKDLMDREFDKIDEVCDENQKLWAFLDKLEEENHSGYSFRTQIETGKTPQELHEGKT